MSNLISDIEAFCGDHGIAQTRFGELVMNDKPFVTQLRNGRRVWPETEAKIRAFMEAYRAERAA